MKRDIRNGIKSSFLYKRFAYYQSEGFVALIKFLEDEELIDDFFEECNFKCSPLAKELELDKNKINLCGFLLSSTCSFGDSKKVNDFWYDKIFRNVNFREIENKLL